MENIGKNIERMQELISTSMNPPPAWARRLQTEAEHMLYVAYKAKESNELDQLTMLDAEAVHLVENRESRI